MFNAETHTQPFPPNTLLVTYMQFCTSTQVMGLNQHKQFLFTQVTFLSVGVCTCGKVNTRSMCYSMISEDVFLWIAYIKLLGFVLKQSNTNALKPRNTKYFVFASWGLWEYTCVKSKGLLLISVIHVRQRLAWRMKCTMPNI